MKEHWDEMFSKCSQRVDDEVSGRASWPISGSKSASRLLWRMYVRSMAVVAVVCSSRVVVANYGGSRALLCRGKELVLWSICS